MSTFDTRSLDSTLAALVAEGDVPGAVSLVARGEDVRVAAHGAFDFGSATPLQRDSLFRIASLTKPITAVATMMLVEDGKLALEDAVDKWLPELANRRVLRRIDSALDDTVPARRAITVRDLLTFTFGFGSVMAMPGSYPIQRPIAEHHLGGDGPPQVSLMPRTDEYLRLLGELPLMYQPGERWLYETSADVLGALVGRASGKSFGGFLRERLFEPLGMKDTSFSVPREQLARLPTLLTVDHATGKPKVFDRGGEQSEYRKTPPMESGSGGLISTAQDYFAFCRMLLNRGTWGSERLLSPESVTELTRDQLTPEQRTGADIFFGQHSSWGLGMAVCIHAGVPWHVPGRYGWDGGFGTSAYSDPRHDLVGILLTQRMMDSPQPPKVYDAFWRETYRSIG